MFENAGSLHFPRGRSIFGKNGNLGVQNSGSLCEGLRQLTRFVLPSTYAIDSYVLDWIDLKLSPTYPTITRSAIIRYIIWKHINDPPTRLELIKAREKSALHFHISFRLSEEFERKMKRYSRTFGTSRAKIFRVFANREVLEQSENS